MKPKNFILITLLGAAMCLCVWWFARQKEDARGKSTEVPKPKQIALPSIGTSIAPPILKPNSVAAGKPVATPTLSTSSDPQSDLKTLIPEIARLIREGNDLDEYLTYENPKNRNPKTIQQLREEKAQNDSDFAQDPQFRIIMDKEHDKRARAWEVMASQTPAFNGAGDEATYKLVEDIGNGSLQDEITFTKIDGKWYED